MVIKNIITIAALSMFLLGCDTAFVRPDKIETEPVKVSGTTYRTYVLVLSYDRNYSNPLDDPNAQREYYAIVGPNAEIHCGSFQGACGPAIRKFNNTPVSGM